MSEMTLEDVAKVLNEKRHSGADCWAPVIVNGKQCFTLVYAYRTISEFEARAITREYRRLDGKLGLTPGPATKAVLDAIREVIDRNPSDKCLWIGGDEGDFGELIGVSCLEAFLAEQEGAK